MTTDNQMTTLTPIAGPYALNVDLVPYEDHDRLAQLFGESDYSKQTIKFYSYIWRCWLAAIHYRDSRLLQRPPEERFTKETVNWVVEAWKARATPVEVLKMLKALRTMARLMLPELVGQPRQRRAGKADDNWLDRLIVELEGDISHDDSSDPLEDTQNVDAEFGDAEPVGDEEHEPWLATLAQATIKERGGKNKSAPRAGQPLSDVSKANSEGYIRSFLAALRKAGVTTRGAELAQLLTAVNVEHYRASIHDPDESWRDAERLRQLRFAFQHAAPSADLSALEASIKTLRQQFPKPTKSAASSTKRFTDEADIPHSEFELFLDALKKDALDYDDDETAYATPSASHEENLYYVLRSFHSALKRQAPDVQAQAPMDRDYERAVEAFLQDLQQTCRPRSCASRLFELKSVLERMLAPKRFEFIASRARELNASDPPDDVWTPDVSTESLRNAGLAMMDDAARRIKDLERYPESKRYRPLLPLAERYRNGLIVLVLSILPLRLRNLSALMVGGSIYWAENHFVIHIEDTKTQKLQLVQDIDAEYTARIERYMNCMRALIWPNFDKKAFWVSRQHGALTPSAFQRIVPKTTFEYCGLEINCHLFRHIRATDESGTSSRPRAAQNALGHVSNVADRRYENKIKRWKLAVEQARKATGGVR